MTILLVGNKSDLDSQRKVSTAEALEFAESNRLQYVEVSAKEATKVEEAFILPTHAIYQKIVTKQLPLGQENIGIKVGDRLEDGKADLSAKQPKKTSSCC
jgi:Ras-related protein Rab-2A